MYLYPILATLAISLIALIGIAIASKQQKNPLWMRRFISLAVGTLLAVTFFDLLPETIEAFDEPHTAFQIVLISIVGFFIIEKAIHYHHCTCDDAHEKSHSHGHTKTHLVTTNLIGDGLHNFIDGTIIAGAFLVDTTLGITTTIAVAVHEIPQEISDFSILVYAGLSKLKAAILNVSFGLLSVVGALSVLLFADRVTHMVPVLLAVASGNFIYLAMADLIPELHHEENPKRIWFHLLWVLLGIAILYVLGIFFGHE